MSRKFQGFSKCRFGDCEKDHFFFKIPNGSINLFENTSKESWLFVFWIKLPKHVYMGKKFQRTLKSSMSLSLSHFFITVTFSTQVAPVPLRALIVTALVWVVKVLFVQYGGRKITVLFSLFVLIKVYLH